MRKIRVHPWLGALLLAAPCLLGSAALAQTSWFVDDNAPGDPRPGDPLMSDPLEDGTANHPFDAIQEAIDAAEDGDTVQILAGTYKGFGNRNLNFLGKAITVRGVAGPGNTVIDPQGIGRGFFFQNEETSDSILEGVLIRGAAAFGDENIGGGIRCDMSSPTIRNCVVTQCTADGFASSGAGLHLNRSNAKFSGCVFSLNVAASFLSSGAGIALDFSDPVFEDCVISNNRTTYIGGGIRSDRNSRPLFKRCQISGNSAQFGGAMVCQSGSRPVFDSCVIRNNSAVSTGGVQCSQCNAEFRNCLFTENISDTLDTGALDNFADSESIISNCTIVNNRDSGVGCFSQNSFVTIENSIIHGNTVDLVNCAANYTLTTEETPGDGNLMGDPLFVGNGNFRLQADSPCVDAGDPAFAFEPGASDLDGHSRVLCEVVDMGAYELGIGDFDCDDAVDLDDFSGWNACATGPGGVIASAECAAFDYDADGDIDLIDLTGFSEGLAR